MREGLRISTLNLERGTLNTLRLSGFKDKKTAEENRTMNTITDYLRVMTSGAFTAAYLELIPRLELVTKKKFVTAATSIGTGETSIPNRLRRGEPVDVVIVNVKWPAPEVLGRYALEHKEPLAPGPLPAHCELVNGAFWTSDIARHDRLRLAYAVWSVLSRRLLG
jgi:hypothetical protein